jgi:hypothetical protein
MGFEGCPQEITIMIETVGQPRPSRKDDATSGVGSDCLMSVIPTPESSRAVLEDVIRGVRLVDALPHLDFLMSMFIPADVPVQTYERHQMKVMLQESTKPIIFCGIEAASTRYAVEMASVVAGGLDSLQRSPFIINYINTVSAFRHNEEAVQRLLFAAERNLPTIYAPANCRGTTAPMTVAGMMALATRDNWLVWYPNSSRLPFNLNHPSVSAMNALDEDLCGPDKGSWVRTGPSLPTSSSRFRGCSDSRCSTPRQRSRLDVICQPNERCKSDSLHWLSRFCNDRIAGVDGLVRRAHWLA